MNDLKMDTDLKKKWREIGHLDNNFPEEYVDDLLKKYETIEKWATKRRKQGPPFNEQFCAGVYAIASITGRDNSFKGKFNPEELYCEMCETMKTLRKGKPDYSLFDEGKMLGQVINNHRKKTPNK